MSSPQVSAGRMTIEVTRALRQQPRVVPNAYEGGAEMTEGTCSVNDCDRPVECSGWCSMHRARKRRHGDPLAGRSPNGAPLLFIQLAASYVGDECLIWPHAKNRFGYGQVEIDGHRHVPHRLVLERTQGPPPSLQHWAAHQPVICHNRLCCNPRHLRWATRRENEGDKVLDGTHQFGERNNQARLKTDQVFAIRADPRPQRVIAAEYDIRQQTVSRIKRGAAWAHLPPIRPTTTTVP